MYSTFQLLFQFVPIPPKSFFKTLYRKTKSALEQKVCCFYIQNNWCNNEKKTCPIVNEFPKSAFSTK